MNSRKSESGHEERRSHRAYKDPTADMAIANIMREERREKRMLERQRQQSSRSFFRGGDRHAGK